MKRKYNYFLLLWLHFFVISTMAQDVTFYQQFSGRYDFTLIGNTLNTAENNQNPNFTFLTESSAELNLSPQQTVLKAYLYWAGSGTGDFDISLNGQPISAERTFSHSRIISGTLFDFFAASTDITEFILENGNGTYTFADIEISEALLQHFPFRTNFSGWSIVIIYEEDTLPINQINLYDGLEGLPSQIDFVLDNLLITNNINSKIAFLAWEGDTFHQNNENIRINGNIVVDLPLNPQNRIFNSTNSITGSTTLYNMDIDVFSLDEFVNIGDTSAEINITSGGDFVLINTVLTKFTTESIDATIEIDLVDVNCASRIIDVDYTVYNLISFNPLPVGTPIAIFANDILIATTATTTPISNGQSESNSITIEIPNTISSPFELTFSVDDFGDGTGIIFEVDENNNTDSQEITFFESPEFNVPEPLLACNEGFSVGTFDLTTVENQVLVNTSDTIRFFETLEEANSGSNPISGISSYQTATPKTIFIRIDNEFCFGVTTLELNTRNCPPIVYNFISANEDGSNDFFLVEGLRDIFLDFKIEIYNRWGHLIWTGNQNTEDWRGEVTEDVKWNGNISVDGTYFYLIFLNDPDYPAPLKGFLYITY